MKKNHTEVQKVDINKMRQTDFRRKYTEEFSKNLQNNITQIKTPHETWTKVVIARNETARNVLRVKQKSIHNITSEKVKDLPTPQERLETKPSHLETRKKRLRVKQRRYETTKKPKQEIKAEIDKIFDSEPKETEKYKDDSNGFYQDIRKIKETSVNL